MKIKTIEPVMSWDGYRGDGLIPTKQISREELEKIYPSAADLDAIADEERIKWLTSK